MQVPSVYGLDTTDVSNWTTNVEKPAVDIIESFLNNSDCKYEPLPLKPLSDITSTQSEDDTYVCEICDRIFVGTFQWNKHKISTKHKKMVHRKNVLESKTNEEEEAVSTSKD